MADIQLVQGDTAPDVEATLRVRQEDDTYAPLDLTNATSVRFQMKRAGTNVYEVDEEATIVTPETGAVRYSFQPGDLNQWGDFEIQWEIHWDNGDEQTTTPAGTAEVRRQ
jgi:hypothetical protein